MIRLLASSTQWEKLNVVSPGYLANRHAIWTASGKFLLTCLWCFSEPHTCLFFSALFLFISCSLGLFFVPVKDQRKKQPEFALKSGFCYIRIETSRLKIHVGLKKFQTPPSQIQLLVPHGLFLERDNYMSVVGGHTSTCYSVKTRQA